MKVAPFIKQQESLTPPPPPLPPQYKRVKKRGRKKSHVTLDLYLFYRRIFLLRWYLRKSRSRRIFARYMGMRKWKKILLAGFKLDMEEDTARFCADQQRYDTRFAKPRHVTAVPLNSAENIRNENFEIPPPLYKAEPVFIPRDNCFSEKLQYFAFTMPDNCMVNDGICKGDRIVAVRNVHPGHRDMVVCALPGLSGVTVRRFAATTNPSLFNLYEGGTVNPLPVFDDNTVLRGVVVSVQRSYYPGKLPPHWEYEEYMQEMQNAASDLKGEK